MAKKNAFDTIAKTGSEIVAAKGVATASTTDPMKKVVDKFVKNKKEQKLLEIEQTELEAKIIEHVRPQQDEMAYCGTFTKSLKVPGEEETLTYTTMDKFSVPQDDETLAAVKKLVGNDTYKSMFEVRKHIAFKKAVLDDKKQVVLNQVAAACAAAGLNIGDIFDVSNLVIAKDDLDLKQYELLEKPTLDTFRTLVKQAKPSLKV